MRLWEPNRTFAEWWSGRRFAVFLAVLLVVAFWDVVLGGRSLFYRDYGVLAYPTVHYARECFGRGEFPFWNPLSNCGAPFMAQWGTMVLYPGSLVYLMLPLPWSLGVFSLGHLLLGGLGMFMLARRWTGNHAGAALAGLVWVFSGCSLSSLIWPNYTVALGLMPFLVLTTERAWFEGGKWIPVGAVVGALQLLSGVPELVLMTWIMVSAIWMGLLARRRVSARALCLRLALMVVLVAGLTAAQMLPFLDLLAHSQRDPGFATAKWSLPVWGWVNLVAPLFHCYKTTQGVFFQHGQEFFSSIYAGGPMLALAAVAVWAAPRGRVIAMFGLGVLGIALALGEGGLVYEWIRTALPLAGMARYPVKFLVLSMFCFSVLSAYGARACLDGAVSGSTVQKRLLVLAGVFLVLLAGAAWVARAFPLPLDQWQAMWQNTVVRAGLLVLVVALLFFLSRAASDGVKALLWAGVLLAVWMDFRTHVPRQNPSIPAQLLKPGLPQPVALPKLGEGRVLISPWADEILLRSRVADFESDFIGKRLAQWSNLNLIEGVPKVNGSATLQVREQAEVQRILYATPSTDLPRLADFLGATHTTSASNVVDWVRRPRARKLIIAGQAPVFAGKEETLQALRAPEFDCSRVVYLPEEAKVLVTAKQAAPANVSKPRYSANRIDFEVHAESAAWVVVAQSYYHRWHAYVNGRPTRLWRANHAFQAIEVPHGDSRVRLAYQDKPFYLGLAISAAAILVCGWLWWSSRRREMRNAK